MHQQWSDCLLFLFSQYILNDGISYPDDTFMDMEFKISVMYDIAKVFIFQFVPLPVGGCSCFIYCFHCI